MTIKSMTSSVNSTDEIYDSNNHIKVIWEDTLDNHSQLREKQIEKYFQNKYKTAKVKVIFKPINNKNSTISVDADADASEIVLDENYQKLLIEKYITDNNINISMDHLMRLDTSVNVELEDYKDHTNRYKTFKIKDIEFSNFLSYGVGNKLSFDSKHGITSVISDPPNFGGKTTMTVDLLLFLFFGTTTKTDKLEEVFNRFSDSDIVEVKGTIEIEGDTYIIKRNIVRKRSREGAYTFKNELDFYQVLPRGGVRQLNGEQRKFTDELIKTYVGSFDDFLITILTTGDNLDDLINTKPTERGRILTRFIGLEFFREKEKIAKKKYTEWKEKSKLYHNNSQDIFNKIDEENEKIEQNTLMISSAMNTQEGLGGEIAALETKKETLFKQRHNDVDTELYQLDEQSIVDGINKVNTLINTKNEEIEKLSNLIPQPEEDYDVDYYGTLKGELKEKTDESVDLKVKINTLTQRISDLKDSEICQTCKRKLDDVNHEHEVIVMCTELESYNMGLETINKRINVLNESITYIDNLKIKWDDYNKNQLLIDKAELDLKNYLDSLERGNQKLLKYRKGKEMIIKNQQIDTDIAVLNLQIKNLVEQKDMVSLQIKGYEKDNEVSVSKIDQYNNLLKELKNEEVIDGIFKTYLDVYGKNGISKMVLSTMIPIINSHLKLLLSDTCEFDLEMRMNEKTEVEFWMIDEETGIEKPINAGSGYEKTVSSLALRCVLSKVCSLPKPNIIVFDEVTGKVSNENLDKIGLFFDKLKLFFDHIWVISHNPLIQDWADNVVKVRKENNISQIIEG